MLRSLRAHSKAGGARLNALLLPLILLDISVPGPAPASEAAPCATCVTWEVDAAEAEMLLQAPGSLDGVDLLIRRAAADPDPAALVADLAARGARVGLMVPMGRWTPQAPPLGQVVIDLRETPSDDPDGLAFRLKTLATEIHASDPGASVGLEAGEDVLASLAERGLAPYVDFLVRPAGHEEAPALGGAPVWTRIRPPRSPESVLAASSAVPGRRLLARAPADRGRTVLALRRLRDVLPEGLTPLDAVAVLCPPAESGCDSRVYLHPGTLDAIAIVTPRGSLRSLGIRPGARSLDLYPLDRAPDAPVATPLAPRRLPSGAFVELPPGLGPFVLKIAGWTGAGEDRFASDVQVVGEKPLTVEEVVARHQAAAARQRQAVARLISSGSMVVTFQVPGLAAPMTVTSDVVIYEGEAIREIEQRSLRLNGVDYGGGDSGVPRLPILEPERVSAPPLAITLDEAYRYRLEGREVVEGQDCYVVAFEPAAGGHNLFRGRAWIAARAFAIVRAEAAQTGLRGPIVSSQQRDAFAAVPVGDTVAWLPARSEVHQVYEGAGHRTPIDRVITLARHEPNPPDFAARRVAAHASASVILSDTPQGFRYLRRVASAAGCAEARRETAGKASRVRALAAGVLVDPNISRPLPFAGLSYVDFDFLSTGAQLNGFFGGVFAQLAWAVPSVGRSRWQLFGSGFAILASYNDRAFTDGIERYEENLRQRPARLSIGAARPLSERSRVRVTYELGYTRLTRSDTTAAEFVVPVSPVVHGLRLAVETQRGAWTAGAWWNPARRQRWRPWGVLGSERGTAGFQRFGLSAARGFVLSPRSVARLEAAWMDGRGLDRFSRYAFDGFENRLRGYPSAAVRYDRGTVAHGVVTWNAARQLRLDGFLDAARVRDPAFGRGARTYVGAGAAIEAPLPLGALASVEWGYGFQARGRAADTGTHVVRVTGYKVF